MKASGQRNGLIASIRNLMLIPQKRMDFSGQNISPCAKNNDDAPLKQAFPFFSSYLLFAAKGTPLLTVLWQQKAASLRPIPSPTALPTQGCRSTMSPQVPGRRVDHRLSEVASQPLGLLGPS